MSQNKHEQEVDEQVRTNIRSLNTKDKIVCTALYNLLNERKAIDKELQEELKVLYSKYTDLSTPLYQSTLELTKGERQPNETEVTDFGEFTENDEELQKLKEVEEIGIPNYWSTVIKNVKAIQKYTNSSDYEILKTLTNIEIFEEKDNSNVAITLHFGENDFFTNSSLHVKVFVSEDDDEVSILS